MSSNLPRVTQKIFAENAGENIGQFGSALSGTANRTGDIEKIQALPAWGQGWAGAVISERDYPPLEEMTGVQKVASQQIAYLFQKGFPEWDEGTTYFANTSFCQVNGVIYRSLTDNNIGHNPTTDTTNWETWKPLEGTYANIDLSNLSETGNAHFANPDLSNLTTTGLDKINQSKALETGNVSSDKDVYADIVKYAHSTFDKSKFVVSGNPIITNDGIASGFSNTNYLKSSSLILGENSWKFSAEFTTGEDISGLQIIACAAGDNITFYNALGVYTNNNQLTLSVNANGSKTANINAAPSTKYVISIEFTGTSYIFSVNGEVINTVSSTDKVPFSQNNINISFGQYFYQGSYYSGFSGSINLKNTYIKINGIPVFSGNITGIDTIKPDDYTVVGSPVISADGIFENTYNQTNYIESTETFDLSSGKFKFQTLINYSGNQKTSAGIMGFISGNNRFAISYNWTSWLINIITDTTLSADFPASYNMPVLLTADCNGSTMQLTALDTNGVSRNSSIDVSSVDFSLFKEAIFKLQAGQWSTTEPFKIDLNLTKLWINGNLIYQPCLKIPYTQSKTGSKIVDVAYRDRVQDMYEQFGYAPYYTIDETNNDFTLPMGEIYGFYEKYKNLLNQISDQRFQELLNLCYPIGMPVPEQNNELAENEVWLEGGIVNIADYPLLFQKYGTKYGGDAITTFGLPDLRNRTFWGSPDGSIGYYGPGLPNIRGAFTFTGDNVARPINGAAREAFYLVQNTEHGPTLENTGNGDALKILEFAFNANQYNSVYQDSFAGFVVPNSFKVRFKTRYK